MGRKRNAMVDPRTGHRLVSRRDFVSHGLLAGLGIFTAPAWTSLLRPGSARAQGLDCGIATGGAGKIPFVCFDLAGGANIAGSNVLVGGQGGQLDLLATEGYEKLGLPVEMMPDRAGQVDTELGIAFHADSAFLRGIRARTSATTRANVNGVVFCARSDNDTGNNPHNPMYGIYRAGADGELVALIGTRSSDSGGRSAAPMSMIDPSVRPTKVDRPRDATGLVDTGKLVELLSQEDATAVMNAVEQISRLKVAGLSEEQIVRDLIACGYIHSAEVVARYGDPSLLDPERDPAIVGGEGSIFGPDELRDGSFRRTASIMKLVVGGFAGAGTVELGGYDYHDSTRATGERRDFRAGEAMGAVLEYAARQGRPVVVYVFSDGSVASNGELDESEDGRGKLIWKGDNSSTAATFMLVYDPAGRPRLSREGAEQVGWFRPNGSVETASFPGAGNVDLLVETVVLNYMALHGEVGRFPQVLPGHGLGSASELDALVAFEPIRTG